MVRPCTIVAALAIVATPACDHGLAATRPVEVRGLPRCSARARYVRPLVVRIDRDRSFFDEPYSAHVRVDEPIDVATLTVTRTRMRVTVRLGVCAATSLGTWDCAAASWLASTTADLDARSTPATVTLPAVDPPCASATR